MIQRLDLYARQLEDGRYLCIRKPLNDWHLEQHLAEDDGVFLAMVIPNELDQAGLAENMEYDKLCRFSGVVPPMTEMLFRSMR